VSGERITFCRQCDALVEQYDRPSWRRFCWPCSSDRYHNNGRKAAKQKVAMAVKRGDLKPAKAYACTDCGAPATEYDHRDYSKPLNVQPVCSRCNKLRGPGKWVQYEPVRQRQVPA
jgi:hypothetical protein